MLNTNKLSRLRLSILFFSFLLILNAKVFGSPIDTRESASINTKEILFKKYPDTKIKGQQKKIEIEVCEDDKCSFFSAKGNYKLDEVWDFAFLCQALLYGDYEFQFIQRKNVIATLSKYQSFCASMTLNNTLVQCVMYQLAKANKIEVGWTNYDEGSKQKGRTEWRSDLKKIELDKY